MMLRALIYPNQMNPFKMVEEDEAKEFYRKMAQLPGTLVPYREPDIGYRGMSICTEEATFHFYTERVCVRGSGGKRFFFDHQRAIEKWLIQIIGSNLPDEEYERYVKPSFLAPKVPCTPL